jgi:DNA-binding MarR family transcriptional regulator
MERRKNQRDKYTSVAFLVTQVGTRAAQMFGERLSPLGYTPPDAGVLRLLARSPGISQQELARRLDMYASRLVALIDALEQRGLVAREPHATDRRLNTLQLTDEGRRALSEIGQAARAHDDMVCKALDAEERAELGRLLKKVADGLGLAEGVHPGYREAGSRQ